LRFPVVVQRNALLELYRTEPIVRLLAKIAAILKPVVNLVLILEQVDAFLLIIFAGDVIRAVELVLKV
jgi:hypothetical protein